jgi:hypothetical protein
MQGVFPVYANARIVAGAPMTDDVFKCEMKAIDKADYKRPVTDAQLAALRAVFPQGVCDYTKKGVMQRPALGTWLSYPPSAAATTITRRLVYGLPSPVLVSPGRRP